MSDMFATEAEAVTFALSIDPAPLMDGEIAQCGVCNRWGLSDEMTFQSEPGHHECPDCITEWQRYVIGDLRRAARTI